MPIRSQYSREIKKNEGYATLSMAACFAALFMSILCAAMGGGTGIVNNTMKVCGVGIFFAILALAHKRQKQKHYAVITLCICSAIIVVAVGMRWFGYIK